MTRSNPSKEGGTSAKGPTDYSDRLVRCLSHDGSDVVDHIRLRARTSGIGAARVTVGFADRQPLLALDDDAEIMVPADRREDGGARSIDASRLSSHVRDRIKGLALRPFVDGMRVRSDNPCVATVRAWDAKTRARWIEDARAITTAELEIGRGA